MTKTINTGNEIGIQKAVIAWSQQPDIRQRWPELSMLYHIPNEGKRSGRYGQALHDAGLKRGVPDLHLPVPKGRYHGLFIELKTANGRPTEAQYWWLEHLKLQGYFAVVCRGYENTIRMLEWYLDLKEVSNDKG